MLRRWRGRQKQWRFSCCRLPRGKHIWCRSGHAIRRPTYKAN